MRNIDKYWNELQNVAKMKMEWGVFNGMIHPCDSQGQTCQYCKFHGNGMIKVTTEKIEFHGGCFQEKNNWLYKENKNDSAA